MPSGLEERVKKSFFSSWEMGSLPLLHGSGQLSFSSKKLDGKPEAAPKDQRGSPARGFGAVSLQHLGLLQMS